MFAAAITTDALDRAVPGCPEWQVRDLVDHLGVVQSFWAAAIRGGGERPEAQPRLDATDAADVRRWFESCNASLQDAIATVPADAPAWTWWGEPRTVGAIARHQAQEAAVHRWDIESAAGTPRPIDAALAADAVDEFVGLSRGLRGPHPVSLRATDTGGVWNAGPEPRVTVSAPASDLLLLLYTRPAAGAVDIDGDRAAFEAFVFAVD